MAEKKKEKVFWRWAPGRIIACGVCYLWLLALDQFSKWLPDTIPDWVFICAFFVGCLIVWNFLSLLQKGEYMKENDIRIVPIDPDNPEKGVAYYRFEGDEGDDWVKDFLKEEADQTSADTEKDFRKDEGASTKNDMS